MTLEFIRNVPVWVWPLFAALMALGWMQSRDRTVSMARALLAPIVLVPLSAYGVWASLGASPLAFIAWGAGVLVGLLLNLLLIKTPRDVKLTPDGRLMVAGSWLPMFLILIIFSARFVMGATKAVAPLAISTPQFTVGFGAGLGVCSGLFLAMALRLMTLQKGTVS